MSNTMTLELTATDVTGQKAVRVKEVPADQSIGDLVDDLLRGLELHASDAEGRPLTYSARLDREGRHLLASERVGEALEPGDRLVLHPSIDAGARR